MLAHETKNNLGQGIRRYGVPFSERSFFWVRANYPHLGQVRIGYPFCVQSLDN